VTSAAPALAAATSSARTALWYLSRGTGVVALLLLTAGVLLGMLETVRWAPRRWPKFSMVMLHRDVSLLSLAFIAVHVATVVLDGFAPIGWKDAMLPFLTPYRPLWVGLGALALDLQIALLASSLLRRHLSFPVWRAVHWLAYVCWPVALLHGLGSGTDTKVTWLLGLDAACVAAVLVVLFWRLSVGWPDAARLRILGGVAAVLAPVLVAVWLAVGPLQPGWAARAGTPASLLSFSASTARAASPSPSPSTSSDNLPDPPFTASLSGTIRQRESEDDQQGVVVIRGILSGGAVGRLLIELEGTALPGGGVQLTQSQVALGGPTGAAIYQGMVTALDGPRIVASLSATGRPSIRLAVDLNIDRFSNTMSGTVIATVAQ
jgi:sulfoxide reductase heme-binding subunit YedZ